MKIKLLGAAGGEVTGSAYLVRSGKANVLVDCGLFQGGRRADTMNRVPVGAVRNLDAVLLTHAHLDHTGRLPLLALAGFGGPVYATAATIELTELILRDSARVQVSEAERKSRRFAREGKPPVRPLYGSEAAEAILRLQREVPYREAVAVAPGITAIWTESGHMLGSASIQLTVEEGGKRTRVVFSGDLGPIGAPMLKDYEPFHAAEAVFLESTYGDRDHRPFGETVREFEKIVAEAVGRKGKILVPTFAVGRAQLIMGLLGAMFRTKKVAPFPIFLDSPMAIEATKIYSRHQELFDDEMKKYLAEGPLRDDLKSLKPCITAQESMQINDQPGPCLVMAGAGMCNAGRILHHLRANLWKPETSLLIVGFQSGGSIGRQIVDGKPFVRIHGEKIAVKARVHTLGGFSAHAGRTDLLGWIGPIASSRPKVFLTHGEDGPRAALAGELRRRFRLKSELPGLNEVLEIA